MRYFIAYFLTLIIFITIAYNFRPSNVKKIFHQIKTEVPGIYISSSFRLNDVNHRTGRAIDIGSKNGKNLLKVFELLCSNSNIRIGIGIEKADRHLHLDEFIVEKKCKNKFLEISKTESYCVDNLSCSEILKKIEPYYNYQRN